MQGLNKTKAALQGRQCNYRKIKPSQITTLIDQVNNLGRVKGCSEVSNGYKLTAPLAQFNRDTRKFPHTENSTYLKSFATWWVCPNLDRPDMSDCPQWGKSTPMADTLNRNSGLAAGGIPPSKQNHRAIVQPFGASLAFLRWRRLISPCKADTTNCPMLSPSSLSSSTELAISCGTRTSNLFDFAFTDFVAITGFPVYWCPTIIHVFFCIESIDLSDTLHLFCVRHLGYSQGVETAKPGSVSPLTGPLTTNDRLNIEVAMLNHTQTRPKYQYRFLALHRSDRSAAPCRLSVEAFTEKEARQVLSAHFILSLAARLPVQEVRHA